MINPLVNNRRAHWWNTSAEEAISRASHLFGSNILVEAGPALISTLVANGLIDRLELSVTEIEGGENPLNFNELLKHFTKIHENNIEGTRFITAQK